MAFKLAEAFVELRAHGMEQISASVKGVRSSLMTLGRGDFSSALNANLSSVRASFAGLRTAASGLGPALAGIGAVGFGKHMVSLAMDAEQTAVSFKVMLGSLEAARQLMGEITAFAAETPFEIPEVAGATKALIAFGSSSKTVIEEVRRLGDIASGVTMPLGELAQIYGKARVQGRLFAEDMNQLTGRGIPIIGEIAKQLGIADSEVKKYVEKGEVNFGMIEQAFISLTSEGGRFHDMMKEQSQTMAGIASTAKDDLNAAMRELGDILGHAVIPKLAEAAKLIKETAQIELAPEEVSGNKFMAGTNELIDRYRAASSHQDRQKVIEENRGRIVDIAKQLQDALKEYEGRSGFNLLGKMNDVANIEALHAALEQARKAQAAFEVIDERNPVKNAIEDSVASPLSKAINSLDTLRGKLESVFRTAAKEAAGMGKSFDSLTNPWKAFAIGFGSQMQRANELGQRFANEHKKLFDETRTPYERYAAEIERLEKLKEKLGNLMSDDTLERAKRKARENLDSELGRENKPSYRTRGGQVAEEERRHREAMEKLDKERSQAQADEDKRHAASMAKINRDKSLSDADAQARIDAEQRRHAAEKDRLERQRSKEFAKAALEEDRRHAAAKNAIAGDKFLSQDERDKRLKDEEERHKAARGRLGKGSSSELLAEEQRRHDARMKEIDASRKVFGEGHEAARADEEKRHRDELSRINKGKPVLSDEEFQRESERLEADHKRRLEDIEENFRREPKFERRGLEEFHHALQQAIGDTMKDHEKEQREVEKVRTLEQIAKNTDPKNNKRDGTARFAAGGN